MNIPRFFWAALALALTLVVSQAQAGACGYKYCWGAVGIGYDGAYGWSHSQYSEAEAISAAQAGCHGECIEIRTFYNTCGAIAVASNGSWGFGWSGSRGGAESNAMNYCRQGGYNCQIKVWSCSP